MSAIWKWVGRHPVVTLFAAVGLLLVGTAIWNLTRPAEDARIQAIRASGYPVTLAELDKWYTPVPEAQNAALWYEKAFATPFGSDQRSLSDLVPEEEVTPPRGQPISSEAQAQLAALFATNQDTFTFLCVATNCAGSRYRLDLRQGFNILLPHVGKHKQGVSLLTARALLDCSRGETQHCAPLFLAASRLSDSLVTEPILISQLVRIACWAIVSKRLELALNLAGLSEPDLAALQQQFARAAATNGMKCGLIGERAFGLAVFIDPKTQAAMVSTPNQFGLVPSGLAGRTMFSALKVSGIMRRDKAFYLDAMATNLAVLDLPLAERLKAARQVSTIPTNRFLIFSRLLLPALGRAVERATEHEMRMRVTTVALAVERFRATHEGAGPESLRDLVPALLAEVPQDLDGRPLRFKTLPKGFVVYSVGTDLQDNDAAERDPKKRQGGGPYDLTFVVERQEGPASRKE